MAQQTFGVDYFNKEYLDMHFPGGTNNPHFQLAEGDSQMRVIARPSDFDLLTLEILQYLEKPEAPKDTYRLNLSANALAQLDKTRKDVLEGILALHNDFATPRRSRKPVMVVDESA